MDKYCGGCGQTKLFSDFQKNRRMKDGLQTVCRACNLERQRAYAQTEKGRAAHLRAQRKYLTTENGRKISQQSATNWRKNNPATDNYHSRTGYMLRRNRVPAWANLDAIRAIYAEADRLSRETGVVYQVDHIVPMKSPIVCGLHCEANLRPLPALENAQKSNLLWPGMPDDPQNVGSFFRIRGRGVRLAQAADVAEFFAHENALHSQKT
jgi:hypothetical protein